MALSLMRTRGTAVTVFKSSVTAAQRPAVIASIRKYTAPAKSENEVTDPKQKALSFIDSLPGNSLISKTGYITLGTGLATYALSKELYVFNEETAILIAFIGLWTALSRIVSKPIVEIREKEAAHINGILRKAREDHKQAVSDRIHTVGQLSDIVDVTKGLFAISKETAELEAEAFELKQKVEVANELRSTLDSWVRFEAAVRERQQKALAEQVIEKVRAKLQDSKLQQQLLEQSVAEVERIVASNTA